MTKPPIRPIHLADAEQCAALAQSVGWPHTAEDWRTRLPWSDGAAFAIEQDGRFVATAAAILYGTTLAWIGMVITHPDYQRRGYSRRLMQATLDHLKERNIACIGLDATEYGYGLYKSLGFRDICRMERWRGHAQPYSHEVPPATEDDISAIIALDGQLFGAERPHIIRTYLAQNPGLAWVMREGDELAGFILARRRGEELHLGPWYHRDPNGAATLFRVALNAIPGATVGLDIYETHEMARSIVQAAGFEKQRFTTRMILGDVPAPPRMAEQFSILSFGTG